MTTAPRPKKTAPADLGRPAAELIDARIAELGGWRGPLLARLRALILAAGPDIAEEWKWNGPVWTCRGIICTGEAYSKAVKLTFPRGASLPDPQGLFNASLAGAARRAIDFSERAKHAEGAEGAEGADVDEAAFQALIRAAADAAR